ncbi:heat shock 70 kDa protein 12A-like, partial [Amia ocellicauda]|uniref:heat shock 70 kDa protein 12A-like n=1 Tax=Amia ocellicauda TaxID=2972642 RepID=UPI00346484E6
LRYLKDHALRFIQDLRNGFKVKPSDVTWVLTVPAIWDSQGKQFMRLAATAANLIADMTSDNLIIALEPEVASVWCKQLSVKDFFEEGSPGGKMEDVPGIQYILVDCGGGTIDITVHEILPDGYLKELHRATGGPWGGECVDENFRLLLKDIFQTDVWDRYEKEFPAEFHMMMYNFSLKKSSEKEEDVDIECLYNLTKLAEKKQDMPLFSKDKSDVTWLEGTIRITYKKFVSLFAESLGEIGGRIEALLSTPGFKINILLFVGGYASSKCLRKEMMRQFGSRAGGGGGG